VGPESSEPQRKMKQHLTSNIFGGESVSTPTKIKQGNDSFLNIFGNPPPSRPMSTPNDQKFKSNIVLNEPAEQPEAKKSLTFSEVTAPDLRSTEGNGMVENSGSCADNPDVKVTNGESTKAEVAAVNGVASTPSSGSTSPTPMAAAPAAAPKQRVPPGGFSQGLW